MSETERLWVTARLATLEQARSDPKTTDRGLATHDRLQDFLDVYDELNDNIDTYVERKSDLRKALKAVIEGDTEFQAKLRALQDDATALESTALHVTIVVPTENSESLTGVQVT